LHSFCALDYLTKYFIIQTDLRKRSGIRIIFHGRARSAIQAEESLLFARLWLGEAWEKGFVHVLRHEGSHVFRDLRGGESFEEEYLVGLGVGRAGHVAWFWPIPIPAIDF